MLAKSFSFNDPPTGDSLIGAVSLSLGTAPLDPGDSLLEPRTTSFEPGGSLLEPGDSSLSSSDPGGGVSGHNVDIFETLAALNCVF